MFLMRRLHKNLFGTGLTMKYTAQEMKGVFLQMRVKVHEFSSDVSLPIEQRLQRRRGYKAGTAEMLLEDIERRFMGKAGDQEELVILIPNSQRHHARHLALYVIETLLYDLLRSYADKAYLSENVEQLATQLTHYALFGDDVNRFAHQLRECASGAENTLEAVGRLHDDPQYDIPLAPALTYLGNTSLQCCCGHVHYTVEGGPGGSPIDIIHQYHFGVRNVLRSGLQHSINLFLASNTARLPHNRWEQRDGVLIYSYSIGRPSSPALARRIHPVPSSENGVTTPVHRVAVIARLR
jgi:hypothetical protein